MDQTIVQDSPIEEKKQAFDTVAFRQHTISISISADVVAGVGTDFAYLRVPRWSTLYQTHQDAYVVLHVPTGSGVTTTALPADEVTAQQLVRYLHEHKGEASIAVLVMQCVAGGGKWIRVREKEVAA